MRQRAYVKIQANGRVAVVADGIAKFKLSSR